MLDQNQTVEVVKTVKGKHHKKIMKVSEWIELSKNKKGNVYQAYQIGFSQFKIEI